MTLEEIVVELRSEIELINRALNDLRLLTGRRATVSGEPQSSLSSSQDIDRHRLEEYRFLRTEIEGIWSQAYTTLNFLLAFIALIVAAAFSKNLDALTRALPFLIGSLATFGGYRLVDVHTARLWRITTYMRCALEPHLNGIAWESRLAARHRAQESHGDNDPLDQSLFHDHLLILDVVNVGLLAGMFRNVFLSTGYSRYFCCAFLLVPIALLLHSQFVRRRTKRGAGRESRQLDSWCLESNGGPVYKSKPAVPVASAVASPQGAVPSNLLEVDTVPSPSGDGGSKAERCPPTRLNDTLHPYYGIFRDYIKHEDGLINNRLNWNFTIQGFLFTAYSFTIQKIAELKANLLSHLALQPSMTQQSVCGTCIVDGDTLNKIVHLLNSTSAGVRELRFIVVVVALVGLFVSILVFLSVWAARTAIFSLENKWVPFCASDAGATKETVSLPGITGGGSADASEMGFYAPLLLPIVFVLAWFFLLCYAFIGYLDIGKVL